MHRCWASVSYTHLDVYKRQQAQRYIWELFTAATLTEEARRKLPQVEALTCLLYTSDRLLQQPALPALVGGRYGRDSHDGSAGRADPHAL